MRVCFLLCPGGRRALRRVLVVLPVGVCLAGAPVLAQTTVAGKIPGEFSVSPSGAAVYRIPIEVPPGVAGMQPQLALSYNSQSGNGIMGVGWSIEGLSAIGRCPKTLATDGVRGAVRLNTEDRFCLDGQRLINVAGAYGAAGSEYRTELESFSRITAHGSAGGSAANGPERFTVQTKAGLTLEYGATADSRIEAQGKVVVRLWALNRMTDASGNAIDFTYVEDQAGGQYLIDTVSYAGRNVKFHYEDRPDRFVGYQSGSKVSQTRRLKAVETRAGGIVLRRAEVGYLPISAPTEKSRPDRWTVCSAGQCLASLSLVYQTAQGMAFGHRELAVGDGPHFAVRTVDMNSDGRADLALWSNGPAGFVQRTRLGDGAGGFGHHQQVLSHSPGENRSVHYVDVNGDGKPDLLHTSFERIHVRPPGTSIDGGYDATSLNIVVAIGDGQGGFDASASQGSIERLEEEHTISPADLNGDGHADLLHMIAGPLRVAVKAWMGNGAGGFAPIETVFAGEKPGYVEMLSGSTPVLMPTFRLSDVNGDGVPDLVYWYGVTQGQLLARARLGDGTGRFGGPLNLPISSMSAHAYSLATKAIHVDLTDINGDGVADIIEFAHDPTQGFVVRARIGDGTGRFELVETPLTGTPHHANRQVLDMNGDGFSDIVYWYFDDVRGLILQLKLGDGAGRFGHQEIVLQDGKGGLAHNIEIVDIDGNGIPDLLYWYFDNARGLVLRSKVNAFQDGGRLREIAQAGQPIVSLEYQSLSGTANLHAKEDSATYPTIDVQFPVQVVSSVSQPNGVGGSNRITYSYGGLKAEHASAQHPGSGRGALGFRWMKSKEEATGIETSTEFSQIWPTIGQVVLSETRLAGAGQAGLLKQSRHQHGCYQSAAVAGSSPPASPTAPCGPWLPGKVYFPHLLTSDEDSWDLDGTAMPRLGTSHTYAGYADQSGGVRQFGDPTHIRVDIHHGGALQHRKDTTNEYFPASTGGGQWRLGRLKRASVSSTSY